tara:strand:- start:3902 stop:4285 length:384 start_codon:yes stop_codon:yes gene_type:complete
MVDDKNFIERTLSSLVEQQLNVSNTLVHRPRQHDIAFHNWEEYKRLGLKWGEPIVIVKIKDNHVFYLEYSNGSYEEKGMILVNNEELQRVKRMQTFLMNKEKNFGHQEGFPIPMKNKLSIFNFHNDI